MVLSTKNHPLICCIFPLAALVVALCGCGGDQSESIVSGDNAKSITTQFSKKVRFKDGEGNVAFELKPKEDGAKLFNSKGEEIARFTYTSFKSESTKIKVKDSDDKTIGYVTTYKDRYKILDASQNEIFEFQARDAGDWKLKTPDEKELYKLKKRDYGYELKQQENSLYKIKFKPPKTSLRDASDKTILSTKDSFPALAMAPFAFDQLDGLPLQCGVAFAIATQLEQD